MNRIRIGKILGAGLLIGGLCLSVTTSPAGAVPGHTDNDIHVAKCACTDCHVKMPVEGDTLETARLTAPVPQLCQQCHQTRPARQ